MKLALLFAVAALLVACVKGITRNSKDESANRFCERFHLTLKAGFDGST